MQASSTKQNPSRPSRQRPARTPTRSSRWRHSVGGLLALLLLAGGAVAEVSRSAVTVEVASSAEKLVDLSATRRLVVLELSDVEVPLPLGWDAARERSLFVRVLSPRQESIVVELWEHGELHGAREVSAVGSRGLRARRIALASAELARSLRRRRDLEQRRAEAKARADAALSGSPGLPIYARVALEPSVLGAMVGPNREALLGPGLAVGLHFTEGPRFALALSSLTGIAASPAVHWREVGLLAGYDWRLGTGSRLGFTGGAMLAHLTLDELGRDGARRPTSELAPRVSIAASLAHATDYGFSVRYGPEFGAVLGDFERSAGTPEAIRLGGLWLGFSLGLSLERPAPPR